MIFIDVFYFSGLVVFMSLLCIVLIIACVARANKRLVHFIECLGYAVALLCFYASLESLARVQIVPLYQFVYMFLVSLAGIWRAFYIGAKQRERGLDAKGIN